ncbi:TPA: GerW family sporulation protein [Candidatus Avacholeplasma faecigallinarum]|nr:GerW family sporulation protein [Candidatus Avacholeplasma faecigallinarum]
MQHPISELLNVSMKSLKEMIDANTIIGNPITYNGVIIIPVSKIHLGFVSGGSDIKPNSNKEDPLFGGGTGGGLSLSPICFLVVNNNEVSVLSIDNSTHLVEKLMDVFPKIFDKVKELKNNNFKIYEDE